MRSKTRYVKPAADEKRLRQGVAALATALRDQEAIMREVEAEIAERLHYERVVGETTEARLLWLGDFVRRDLATPEACHVAARELSAVVSRHVGRAINVAADADLVTSRIPAEDVADIQETIRAAYDGLRPGGPIWFPTAIVDGLVWSGGRIVPVTRTEGVPQVLAAVVQALIDAGSRLRRCATPTCGTLFVQSRTDQIRCSVQCGGRFRAAQKLLRDRERLADRKHRQYVKTARKRRNYPRLDVKRRPRRVKS